MNIEKVWYFRRKKDFTEVLELLRDAHVPYQLIAPYEFTEETEKKSQVYAIAKWALAGGLAGGVGFYLLAWIGTWAFKNIVAGQQYHHPGFTLMGYVGAILGATVVGSFGFVLRADLVNYDRPNWEEAAAARVRYGGFVLRVTVPTLALYEKIVGTYFPEELQKGEI